MPCAVLPGQGSSSRGRAAAGRADPGPCRVNSSGRYFSWPASSSGSAACRRTSSPAPGRGCDEHVHQRFRAPDRGDARLRTSLGHTLRDMRTRWPVSTGSAPRITPRDGADPGTGDRVVQGHGDGTWAPPDPRDPRVRQVPPAGRRGRIHRAVSVDRQPGPEPAAHVHRRELAAFFRPPTPSPPSTAARSASTRSRSSSG